LSHGGPIEVNREAELKGPTAVGSGDWSSGNLMVTTKTNSHLNETQALHDNVDKLPKSGVTDNHGHDAI